MTKLLLEDRGDVLAVRCPFCESTALHHDEVTVFERSEVAPVKLRVDIRGVDAEPIGGELRTRFPSLHVDEYMGGNPSDRHSGVRIGMWCAGCDKRSVFMIAQHAGQTLLSCGKVLPWVQVPQLREVP
jgi:hypothetical protein